MLASSAEVLEVDGAVSLVVKEDERRADGQA